MYNPACVHAALKDTSALFRHDVAFCLGQRQDPAAIEQLTTILHNPAEHAMWVTVSRTGTDLCTPAHPACVAAKPSHAGPA